MSLGPATSFTTPIDTVLGAVATALSNPGVWTVTKYGGTSAEKVFDWIPALKPLPQAIIMYEGGKWYDIPLRRNWLFHVIIVQAATQKQYDNMFKSPVELMEAAVAKLDWKIITGDAKCEVVEDAGLDFGPTLGVFDVTFRIKDP